MNTNRSLFSKLGVATRLMLWFLAIALIPCILLTIVTNNLAMRSLEKTLRDRLVTVAAFKAAELNNFARERAANLSILSQIPSTRAAVLEQIKDLEAGGPPAGVRRDYPGFPLFCETYGYEN